MILAIESTCDESSVALIEKGPKVVYEATASQVDLHEKWGGVVPELASRAHQESLLPLTMSVLKNANISWDEINAIAVAHQPGLMGPLLVGTAFAKALAFSLKIKLIGVNHLYGHLASVMLENRSIHPDSLGLLVSGGHTLILERKNSRWHILGGTRDDAAGEAFDKGARLLGLPYPGGAHLSKLASGGDPDKLPFPVSEMEEFELSFSGLKSELRRRIESDILKKYSPEDVAAGYQKAIIETLKRPLIKILKERSYPSLVVAGGVSRNEDLRENLYQLGDVHRLEVMFPENRWCTDNAAMIGAAAWERFERGESDGFDLTPSARINPRILLKQETL